MQTITVKSELSIEKPISEVFEAVLKPIPFFIGKASGPMRKGEAITWEFADFPKSFSIQVKEVIPNELIIFEWPRGEGNEMNTVTFKFKAFSDAITTVFVSESGWPATDQYRESSYRNCMGWTHMVCSLKAWLEHGVNLRKNAFVHKKM